MSISRRGFIGWAGCLAAGGLGFPFLSVAGESRSWRAGQKPRRIIHLVSDGTSWGTICLADQFSRLLRQRGLIWLESCQNPDACTATVNMRSLNSVVTDSAAAASSWGCGSRVVNGVLNELPDGRKLRTLYQLLGDAGWSRGLVTTTELTHATPAGFAVNSAKRDASEDIARQYLDRKIEVLLGGGRTFFLPHKRKDKRDLRLEYRREGYAVMDTLSELATAPGDQRWLGLFSPGHLPYTIDHLNSATDVMMVPSLARMTEFALNRLNRAPHFILQVEGGRVDHGAHGCDAAAAIRDLIAFDEAIEVCLEFQRQAPDTLLVITVDHGTGGPALLGLGDQYGKSPAMLANVGRVRCSFEVMNKQLGSSASLAKITEIIGDATGYKVPSAKAQAFVPFLEKKGSALFDSMNSASAQLGQLMANHLGISWTGGSHTSDYVPLLALGPGAERFRGFIQNTDVFKHYMALAGIDFRNPSAALLAESGPTAVEVEAGESYLRGLSGAA